MNSLDDARALIALKGCVLCKGPIVTLITMKCIACGMPGICWNRACTHGLLEPGAGWPHMWCNDSDSVSVQRVDITQERVVTGVWFACERSEHYLSRTIHTTIEESHRILTYRELPYSLVNAYYCNSRRKPLEKEEVISGKM